MDMTRWDQIMNVLFVCSGGMSSAIVVQNLEQEAQRKGLTLNVLAVGISEFAEEVKKNWDLVLVAPQVRHRFASLKKMADESDVRCELIPPESYHPLGSSALLVKIQEFIRK